MVGITMLCGIRGTDGHWKAWQAVEPKRGKSVATGAATPLHVSRDNGTPMIRSCYTPHHASDSFSVHAIPPKAQSPVLWHELARGAPMPVMPVAQPMNVQPSLEPSGTDLPDALKTSLLNTTMLIMTMDTHDGPLYRKATKIKE
jgi:hypothetical protein